MSVLSRAPSLQKWGAEGWSNVRWEFGSRLTIVVQELFNEINVSEYHPPTAISPQLQFVQGLSDDDALQTKIVERDERAHPSEMSFARRSR